MNAEIIKMEVLHYVYNLISGRSGKQRSIDNTLSLGNWRFIQLGNYTSVSPLSIIQDSTTKITFQQTDITFADGFELNLNYDYMNQKFTPQTLGDVFLVEVRFKAQCSAPNGAYEIRLESPTFAYNPIQSKSGFISKAANTEQFLSIAVPLFIGADIKSNGLEVKFKAESGNFILYDVSYMIIRLSSGIPFTP